MSRLTSCCACDGCEPEQLFWREAGQPLPTGPTGCVTGKTMYYSYPPREETFQILNSGCAGLRVTNATERNVLVFDVFVEGQTTGLPNAWRKAPGNFSTELRLWCDENGANEKAVFRLTGMLGSTINFETDDLETFTPVQDISVAGYTNCTGAKQYSVEMQLQVGDNIQTAKVIAVPRTAFLESPEVWTRRLNAQRFHFRVTATRMDGDCDVWVALTSANAATDFASGFNSYLAYRESDEIEQTGWIPTEFTRVGTNLIDSYASQFFAANQNGGVLHFFDTKTVGDDGTCGAASTTTAESCVISVRAMGYTTNLPPTKAVVPEDGDLQCFCTPTGATGPADCYVDRTRSGAVSPPNPYRYPWYISPCSHTKKSGHVTHAMLSKNLTRLSLTLPELGAYNAGDSYLESLLKGLAGTYELSPDIGGSPLANNQFFLNAGGLPTVETPIFSIGTLFVDIDSVVIGATTRAWLGSLVNGTELGFTAPAWTSWPPCVGASDDWVALTQVYVFVRGLQRVVLFEGNPTQQPFAFFLSGEIACGSDFYRGIEQSFEANDSMRGGMPVRFYGYPAEYHINCFDRAGDGYGLTNGWYLIAPGGTTKVQLVE